MKIIPNFIAHQIFHKGYWLNPVNYNSWYYFQPTKRDFSHQLPKNFYSSLDNQFKDIVPYLHQNGIPTTPSCTGHFKKESIFKNVFNDLKNQKNIINKDGLLLQNPETGEFLNYYDPNYNLPWDKDQFVNKCSEYQKKGCFGMIINDYYLKNELMDMDFNADTYWDDSDKCFIIITNPENEKEMNDNWGFIKSLIMDII